MTAEEETDDRGGIFANMLCPFNETLRIPCNIFLVIRRHVHLNGAVLTGMAIQPWVRGNAGSFKKYLNHIFRDTDIHLLLDGVSPTFRISYAKEFRKRKRHYSYTGSHQQNAQNVR
jgi:hypothetical protein